MQKIQKTIQKLCKIPGFPRDPCGDPCEDPCGDPCGDVPPRNILLLHNRSRDAKLAQGKKEMLPRKQRNRPGQKDI